MANLRELSPSRRAPDSDGRYPHFSESDSSKRSRRSKQPSCQRHAGDCAELPSDTDGLQSRPLRLVEPAFEPLRERCNGRLTITRRCQQMQVVGHGDRRQNVPLIEARKHTQAGLPNFLVRQDRLPRPDAKSDKLDRRLLPRQPFRNPRRARHATILGRFCETPTHTSR